MTRREHEPTDADDRDVPLDDPQRPDPPIVDDDPVVEPGVDGLSDVPGHERGPESEPLEP